VIAVTGELRVGRLRGRVVNADGVYWLMAAEPFADSWFPACALSVHSIEQAEQALRVGQEGLERALAAFGRPWREMDADSILMFDALITGDDELCDELVRWSHVELREMRRWVKPFNVDPWRNAVEMVRALKLLGEHSGR
jgi:hypothetical protein